MTEKNNNDKLNNNKDISTLMNLFDDDSSIENIQKQIEKTQEQLINNAIQKIKKITDDGDIDTADQLLEMLVDKFSDNDILNNERYKIERFIRTKEADIQIQKAKSLFNEGKYTEASELLEKTITRTDKQDNILVGYKKSFQTQQEQADKQTIEKNIQELVKKITEAYNNNTPIDDILIKYIDDLRELIGNNTDNDKLLNTALIDILKTVFEQISIAVINKDSKRFLQILEVLKKKMVFEGHPIISKLYNIIDDSQKDDIFTLEKDIDKIKKILNIPTQLSSKTAKIDNIDKILIPSGYNRKKILNILGKGPHKAVPFLKKAYKHFKLDNRRQRETSLDGRFINMRYNIKRYGPYGDGYIDKKLLDSGKIKKGNENIGYVELLKYLENKRIVSREDTHGEWRLEIVK